MGRCVFMQEYHILQAVLFFFISLLTIRFCYIANGKNCKIRCAIRTVVFFVCFAIICSWCVWFFLPPIFAFKKLVFFYPSFILLLLWLILAMYIKINLFLYRAKVVIDHLIRCDSKQRRLELGMKYEQWNVFSTQLKLFSITICYIDLFHHFRYEDALDLKYGEPFYISGGFKGLTVLEQNK